MVLGLTAPAIDVIIDQAGAAAFEIGDNEAAVCALRSRLNAGDDPFGPAPIGGAVVELLVAAQLLAARDHVEASLGAGLKGFDVARRAVVGATPTMKSMSFGFGDFVWSVLAKHLELKSVLEKATGSKWINI